MDFVEPIRDRKKIAQIKNYLVGGRRYRDYLLFVMGINTALRISDLLRLQVEMVLDEAGQMRERFVIREEKRGKRNEVTVNDSIREALTLYLKAYPGINRRGSEYLFFSTKYRDYWYFAPITRSQAWRIISGVCQDVGLSGNYGTHTLRKTWGYHARQAGVPMEIIMEKLNHTSFAFTKRYLGITDDELKAAAEKLNL